MDVKKENSQNLLNTCEKLITKEGIDLRTLLSILRSNDISLQQEWIEKLFVTYNHKKKNFFQTKERFYKTDRLFTEAYMLHHNCKLLKNNSLKGYEKAHLSRFNERVRIKYQHPLSDFGFYDYLYRWVENPDKTEDEVVCAFIKEKGIVLDKMLSYHELSHLFHNSSDKTEDFDTSFQKAITSYRIKSIKAEKANDIKTALLYRDSILRSNPFLKTSDAQKAKRLAMKKKLKAEYLYYLEYSVKQSINPNYYADTLPTFGRTKEDTAFVKSALKDLSPKTANPLPDINYDLLLLSNRYSEQHDFAAGFTYPKYPLLEDKNRKAKLFVSYVLPSYMEYPYSIKFLTRSPSDFLNEVNFAFSYVTLHLLQYNFREHLIEEHVFENFLSTHAILVNMKVADAENYYWLFDCYNTSYKRKESQYGWKMNEREDETIVDNALTRSNRESVFLLPIEYLE